MSKIEHMLSRARRGFGDPYRQLAAAHLLRAWRDYKRGRPCDYKNCGHGAHRCRESALRWLTTPGEAAECFMEYLGLDQWTVMEELGLLDEHYDPTFEWGGEGLE